MTHVVSCFNTGQITLPKKWRDAHKSKKYIAEETVEGLLIRPLQKEKTIKITSFESDKEDGVIFPEGIDPDDLIKVMQDIDG